MSDYEIRDGVPIPDNRGGKRKDYPFERLKLGECILVGIGCRSHLANRAREFQLTNPGWKLRGASIEVDGRKRFGFWCVARPDGPANNSLITRNPAPDAAAPGPAPFRTFTAPAARISTTPGGSAGDASAVAERLRAAAKLTKPGKRTVAAK